MAKASACPFNAPKELDMWVCEVALRSSDRVVRRNIFSSLYSYGGIETRGFGACIFAERV